MKATSIPFIPKKKWRSAFVGNYASAFRGAGIEFGNIREYVPGDDSKYIDWRSSAKGNKLFVKEFEESRNVTILLFLDAAANMSFGTIPTKKWQKTLELFEVLAYGAAQNHDRIGGGIFGAEPKVFFPAKSGMTNAHLIKHRYTEASLAPEPGFSSSGRLVKALYKKQLKRNVIFIVSDAFDDIDPQELRSLASRNEMVFIQILDPFEISGIIPFGVRLSDGHQTVSVAEGKDTTAFLQAMHLQMEKTKKMIGNVGGSYLSLATDEDVYAALFRFFKTRQ